MYNLKEFRNYIGIKQTELAFLFGCTQPYIAKIERLRSDLTSEQKQILNEKFGSDIVEKFTIQENEIVREYNESKELADKIEELKGQLKEAYEEIGRLNMEIRSLKEKKARTN